MQAPRTVRGQVKAETRQTETSAGMIATAVAMAAMLLLAAMGAASAQDVDLGRYNDWRAHSYQEDGGTVCNMWSRPTRHEEQGRPRGEIYAFVTQRPSIGAEDDFSLQMGYEIQSGSQVTVQIGSQSWKLFAEGEAAFAYSEDEPALVQAMRRGSTMVVEAVSQRGTPTKDTYSLSGFTAAHKKITEACG